jgi:hypothetical protein
MGDEAFETDGVDEPSPTTCGLSGTIFLGTLQNCAVVSTILCTYLGVGFLAVWMVKLGLVVDSPIAAVFLFSMTFVAGRAVYLSCFPPAPHSVHADSPAECWRPDEPTALPDDPGDMMSELRYSA